MSNFIRQSSTELRHFWQQICIVLVLVVIARGQSLFAPMYSIDSYISQIAHHPDGTFNFFMSEGRFGLAVLLGFSDRLGLYSIDTSVASTTISTLLFVVSAFFLLSMITQKPSKFEFFIFTAIFVLHPYMTEFYYFSDATFAIAAATFVAAIGAKLLGGSRRRIFLGIVLIALAMSIYQTTVAFVLTLGLLAVGKSIAFGGSEDNAPPQLNYIYKIFYIIAGAALYLAIANFFSFTSGIRLDSRTSPESLLDVKTKFLVLLRAVRYAFQPDGLFLPPTVVVLVVAVSIFSFVVLLAKPMRGLRVLAVLACLALVTVALVVAAGLTSMGGVVWIVPRTLTPIAAFEAGLIAIGWRLTGRVGRHIMAGALAMILIGFIAASNHILHDQWRVNLADVQQAGRIVGRLEQDERFRSIRTIVINGTGHARTAPIPTEWGDMNVPAIEAQDSQIGLIEVATGYSFSSPTVGDRAKAQAFCSKMPKWPAPASVSVVDDLGMVCFSVIGE